MGYLTGLPIPLFVGVVFGGMVSNVYHMCLHGKRNKERARSFSQRPGLDGLDKTEGLGYSMKIMSKS